MPSKWVEIGRKGGRASGDARLLKGRESLLKCRTFREVVRWAQEREVLAWQRGYKAGERAGFKRGYLDRVRVA